MSKYRRYRCPMPECRGIFDYLHHPNEVDDPYPVCPHCGYTTREDEPTPERVVTAPIIGKAENKSADQVYRAMEASSEHRIQKVAEATGASESDLSHMKITNLNDRLREGDVAHKAITVPTHAAPTAGMLNQAGVMNNVAGAQWAGMTGIGPEAHSGSKAFGMLKRIHERGAV